jgi:hypothetical protein
MMKAAPLQQQQQQQQGQRRKLLTSATLSLRQMMRAWQHGSGAIQLGLSSTKHLKHQQQQQQQRIGQ